MGNIDKIQASATPYTVTIDDDPTVSKIIEAALGTPTVSFSSTRDVLEQNTLNPQAIFVDIHLDQENGLAALPKFREMFRYCPIIVITGDSNDKALAEALTLGADDFIMKPLRPREVVARLQARLADQALKQASQSLVFGDVQLDRGHRVLRGPKGERFLSPTEMNLLVALMRSAALDRKVFEVRRALLDGGSRCSIGTAYGVGFFLEQSREEDSAGTGR